MSRQSYSVCRDETLYHEPLLFKPERYLIAEVKLNFRWLGLTQELEAKMWDATMIFSHGPRICLGNEYCLV